MRSSAKTQDRGAGVPPAKNSPAEPGKGIPEESDPVPAPVKKKRQYVAPVPPPPQPAPTKREPASPALKAARVDVPAEPPKNSGRRSQPKLEKEIAARSKPPVPTTTKTTKKQFLQNEPKRAGLPKTKDKSVRVEPKVATPEPKPVEKRRAKKRKPAVSLKESLPVGTVTVATVAKAKSQKKKLRNEPEKIAPAKSTSVKAERPKPSLTKPATVNHPVPAKPPTPKKVSRDRRVATSTVYIARGGTLRGLADYEVAFPTRQQAVAFVANQHGLTHEEQRKLAKEARLKLNRRYHGSDACTVKELRMTPEQAAQALAGEMP